jgi:hypothetical protein
MNKLKLFKFLPTALIVLALSNPSKVYSSPVSYVGKKGHYTINSQTGVYQGCVYSRPECLSLGVKSKIGPSSWKNGDYTYSVSANGIHVYKKSKEIFEDTFAKQPSTETLISLDGIGQAKLGMTYGQLKTKLGKAYQFKPATLIFPHLVGRGIAIVHSGKIQYYAFGSINGQISNQMSDKNKIDALVTYNQSYKTSAGIGPGSLLVDAEKFYGKASIRYGETMKGKEKFKQEYVLFPKAPDDSPPHEVGKDGYLFFFLKPISGIYSKLENLDSGFGDSKTNKFKSGTTIQWIGLHGNGYNLF